MLADGLSGAADTCQPITHFCSQLVRERDTNVNDTLKYVKLWLTFVGGVLIVAVLYWAQAVLVPFALAVLLTFVLPRRSTGCNDRSVECLPCCWS